VPKQGNAIGHLDKLIKKGGINDLLQNILKNNRINPENVSIQNTEEGKGKEGEVMEGFNYKKYIGKMSGERKKFMSKTPFITRFELSLLKSKTRDGLMLKSMDQHGTKDAKIVTEGLFKALLEQIGQQGPVPFNSITRTGTF